LTVADEGTYTVNTTTGVVTFDPLPTFTGTASPVKYVVADNFGQKTSATITPTVSLPDPPTAANNTSSGDFDTNQTIRPVTNDSAGSGASLVASSVRLCATTSTANASCTLTSLTVADEGTYTVNTTTGVVTFDPLPTFTGTASPVKYVVQDTTGQIAGATVTPTVSLPDPPVATPESKAVIPGGTATFTTVSGSGGLGSSVAGLDTSLTCLFTPGTSICDADGVVTVSGEGTYTLNQSTGVVTFVADVNATQGNKTAVTYQIVDQFGQTATSTLTPVVPAPPVAVNDTSSGEFDTNQVFSPLNNDTPDTAASLVPSTVRLCATTSTANSVCRLTSLTVPGEGTYTVNTTTGVVTFDPLPTFTGTASPVKYVVADVVGQIVHATITPTVGEEELPPTGINAMEKLVVSALLLLTIGLGLNRAKFWAS
jgi:CshA-type fibril repeat protein